MQKLGFIGFVLALLAMLAGLYNQFIFLPKVDAIEHGRLWAEAHHTGVLIGEITLLAGIIALVLCMVSVIKSKNKWTIIGLVLSFAAIILGLLQGTHMFS